jgi:signal transduction histidine kinase
MVMAVDPDKIERIMLNLLSNAVKFTNPGGEIIVNLYERNESLCISVKDSGIGIPGDKLGVIFDRFMQVDKSLTRSREGSGIGLALVKSLVQLHDGCISVNSIEGEGSEFIIELPVKLIPENQNPYHDESKVENSIIERIHIEFSDIYTL